MHIRFAYVASAVLGLALPLVAATTIAHAGDPFSISVPDDHVTLKQDVTVNGTNACPNSPYTVTLSYTKQDGAMGATEATGTTDGEGQFSQAVTVPEAATPGQPAGVQATTSCSAPSPSSTEAARMGSGQTSNTVPITIEVAQGTLSTDRTQGRAGTVVHVSGTNCLGDDVVVVFGNDSGAEAVPVTLLPDDTFSGDYTIPNVPPGPYFFAAECPGTDYADRAFTVLVTPGATPAPLPTSIPRRPVNYTG